MEIAITTRAYKAEALEYIPQYAHFRPKYFPTYGTTTIVRSSSSCCRLSSHSRSASSIRSSSESIESLGDASESRSSLSGDGIESVMLCGVISTDK